MTALKEFERLEATGLWRPSRDAQRREVIVSLGDATLTISDLRDTVLTHWSLAAVRRANKGQRPALYFPDGDPGETLELTDESAEMIAAVEKVLSAIDRRRPRPGRVRLVSTLSVAAVLLLLAVFWLPGALVSHTLRVLPAVKRAEIGLTLLGHINRVTGQPCSEASALPALDALSERLTGAPGNILVLPGGSRVSAHLPGALILLNRTLVEDWEDPEVAAGYVIAEGVRAAQDDPVRQVLDHAGLLASLRLLTTGALPPDALARYAETLMLSDPAPLPAEALLPAFAEARVSSRPYAYAQDLTGESVLDLIEADPMAGQAEPVLGDSDWVRLQGICGA